MISTRLAAFLAARRIHYGWVVLGVTFVVMLATAGAMGASGVIIQPLEAEFGWPNADISSALALRLALFGLMGPFAAAFINRFGLRAVVASAMALVVAGILGTIVMGSLWQFVLSWGVVVGLGTGMTALVLGATVATRWFSARRGLAVGLLTASNATGQLVFLPLLASVTQHWGWRAALALVIALLLGALLLAVTFMRDRPADVGLPLFGETTIAPAPKGAGNLAAMFWSPIAALRDASHSRVFWVLFTTFFVCGLSTNGLIQTHWITLCGDYGVAPVGAAGILAAIGVFDFFGTILSGWLSDRFDNRWLLFFYYGLRGLSLIYLPYTEFSIISLSVFGVFYGLDWVATVPPTVRLNADAFGAERANLTFGWIFAGHQLGAATAALGAGAARTEYATYLPALYIAGSACLIASALIMTLARPRRRALAPA
jgi:predicted MFS family arabinose efflux permease